MSTETWKGMKDIWRRVPKIAVTILLLLIVTAIFADFLTLHDPEIGDPRQRLLPPAWETTGQWTYPLGTDTMGRDVLSRLIYGSRVSLIVAFAAVIIAGCIGTFLGLLAGFFGGWVDQVIMRFTDAWLSIPTVMFGVLMAVILGPGVWNIVIILGGTFWSRYARVVRGETLSMKTRDFVQLARIAGCGTPASSGSISSPMSSAASSRSHPCKSGSLSSWRPPSPSSASGSRRPSRPGG